MDGSYGFLHYLLLSCTILIYFSLTIFLPYSDLEVKKVKIHEWGAGKAGITGGIENVPIWRLHYCYNCLHIHSNNESRIRNCPRAVATLKDEETQT